MKRMLLLAGTACLFTLHPYAQGIIVNEISQGPAGAQEFIELLVVGSATQATSTVDLRDWIIDDNNGDFQLADNSAPGIATGHFRLAPNDTFAAVPIGALIVIYNANDPNPAWTFRQFDGSSQDIAHIEDGGFTYYIPGTSTLLRACSGTPSNTSTSYVYTSSTIPPLPANWVGQIGLANNGDAIQVRKPDGTFYHGFGFSTPTIANSFTTFSTFSEVGLPSFNGYTGIATNVVTYFDCGSYYFSNNFLSGASANETPGAANTANNNLLINNIRAGFFQYNQLGANVLCSQVLPVQLLYFTGALSGKKVYLQWATASEHNNARFLIERSADQKHWHTIGMLPGSQQSNDRKEYQFWDETPLQNISFYRLAQEDADGSRSYSSIVVVRNSQGGTYLYPNPVTGSECTVQTTETIQHYELYDMLGRKISKLPLLAKNAYNISLDMSQVPKGMYYLRVYFDRTMLTLPLTRN